MAIQVAKCYQQYPQVPLKELTGFYTVGNHQFDATPASGATPAQTHRVALLSMLPKTLMIHDALRFNNRYVLFAEAVDQLTSVTWTADLYLNGVKQPADDSFLKVDTSNSFELNLSFTGKLLAANGQPRYDKLIINCEVKKLAKTIQLSLQHQFARALDAKGLSSGTQSVPFMGAPETFYFIENNIKEFFPDEQLKWNGQPIASDQQENAALMVLTLSILYYSIQTSQTVRFELLKEMNIDDLQDPELLLSLLMNRPYKGQLRVGFGNLPLHIVNQAMTNLGTVPNFAAIPNTNKIFAILADTTEFFYNEAEAILLNRIPDRLLECRTELLAAPDRAFSLYWMAMFPKSAICMTAIMVKFLFEASKKNTFKECKNKKPEFSQATLATYKEHPYLFRNILTHYYQDPHSKVKTFSKDALKVVSLAHSPYPSILYTVNNPRILSAYFAKRVVKRISADYHEVYFERIGREMLVNSAGMLVEEDGTVRTDSAGAQIPKPAWDNFLGRTNFLLVETWSCRQKQTRCTLTINNVTPTSGVSNNNLIVKAGPLFQSNIDQGLKQFAQVQTNQNLYSGNNQVLAEEFLTVNFADTTIVKVSLHPQTDAEFANWTNALANANQELHITTQLADDTPCFFGNKLDASSVSSEFLTSNDPYDNNRRYCVENAIVYEIFHELNTFNTLSLQGAQRRKIRRIRNPFVFNLALGTSSPAQKAVYFYYDDLDQEHFFGSFPILKIAKWISASSSDAANPVQLVDASELTNIYNYRGVIMGFRNFNSPREYINLECLAGLMGAMARLNLDSIGCNGFSNADGSPTPSSSHKNGVAGDLRYIRTDRNGLQCTLTSNNFDYNTQVQFNEQLFNYGWGRATLMLSERFIRNGNSTLLPHCSHFHVTTKNGITYNTEDVGAATSPQRVIAPLPANAVLLVGDIINQAASVRHNDHLHIQGHDFNPVGEGIF